MFTSNREKLQSLEALTVTDWKAYLTAQVSWGQYVVDLAGHKKLLKLLREVNCSMRDMQVANTKYQDHQPLQGIARPLQGSIWKPKDPARSSRGFQMSRGLPSATEPFKQGSQVVSNHHLKKEGGRGLCETCATAEQRNYPQLLAGNARQQGKVFA